MVTFICLIICEKIGIFKIKQVPFFKLFSITILFGILVYLTNHSLQYNSVGNYQCLKSLNTFIIVVISITIHDQKYSTYLIVSVVFLKIC